MNATAAIFGIYVFLGVLGLIAGIFVPRFAASGERALKLSVGAILLPLLAWHRPVADPVAILTLSLFCFAAPVALAYGFHTRRSGSDRGLAWAGLVLSIVTFGLFVCWMIASTLNFGEAIGLLS